MAYAMWPSKCAKDVGFATSKCAVVFVIPRCHLAWGSLTWPWIFLTFSIQQQKEAGIKRHIHKYAISVIIPLTLNEWAFTFTEISLCPAREMKCLHYAPVEQYSPHTRSKVHTAFPRCCAYLSDNPLKGKYRKAEKQQKCKPFICLCLAGL